MLLLLTEPPSNGSEWFRMILCCYSYSEAESNFIPFESGLASLACLTQNAVEGWAITSLAEFCQDSSGAYSWEAPFRITLVRYTQSKLHREVIVGTQDHSPCCWQLTVHILANHESELS